MSNKKLIIFFSFFIFLQFSFSIFFPPYSNNECWKKLEIAGTYKGRSVANFDKKVLDNVSFILQNYRLNCDAGGYMLLAHDFPKDYFRGRTLFINRPLYSFFVYVFGVPFRLVSNSYSITFAVGLLSNTILLLITSILMFKLLVNYCSERVSFLSCLLFIFSPFVHSWLVQPETNIFGAFSTVTVLYLLYHYSVKPSLNKLILYSFVAGFLMLGKMNLALAFFIIIVGLFFRRFKELFIFTILYSLPILLWYIFVTKIWGLSFVVQEVTNFKAGIWVFDMLHGSLEQNIIILLGVLPKFINSLIYGFFLIPVFFSLIGIYVIKLRYKYLFFYGMLFSYLLLFFALDIYLPRHAFLLFPLLLPLTVVGIDHVCNVLSVYKYFNTKVYYILVYALIFLPSLINVIDIYNKLNIPYS